MSDVRILIVEDQVIMAQDLTAQLKELGYQHIDHALNSRVASKKYTSNDYDLLIMDIGLENSDKDGIDIAKALQKLEEVPVIFLSGYSDQKTINRVKKVPHSNYLIKPCSLRQLYVSVDAALSNYLPEEISELEKNDQHNLPAVSKNNAFYVKGNGKIYHKIKVENLLYIESVRGGIKLALINGKQHIMSTTLTSFNNQFQHPNLIKVNRGHIINQNYVDSIKEKKFVLSHQKTKAEIPYSLGQWKKIKHLFPRLKSD